MPNKNGIAEIKRAFTVRMLLYALAALTTATLTWLALNEFNQRDLFERNFENGTISALVYMTTAQKRLPQENVSSLDGRGGVDRLMISESPKKQLVVFDIANSQLTLVEEDSVKQRLFYNFEIYQSHEFPTVFISGPANDQMMGGRPSRFVLHPKFGTDLIYEFKPGEDKLDFMLFKISFSDLSFRDGQGLTSIYLRDREVVRLENLLANDLSKNDFLF